MARRRQLCDVPGCGQSRLRWQRLCDRCWRTLPHDIRTAIVEAFRLHHRPAHRAACKRAEAHFAEQAQQQAAAAERSPQWWQQD